MPSSTMFSSPTILAAAVLSEPTDVEAAETPDGLGRPYMDVVFCSLPKLFNPPEGQGAGKLFAPRAPSNGGAIDARSPNWAADMGTVGSVLDSPKDSPPPGQPDQVHEGAPPCCADSPRPETTSIFPEEAASYQTTTSRRSPPSI